MSIEFNPECRTFDPEDVLALVMLPQIEYRKVKKKHLNIHQRKYKGEIHMTNNQSNQYTVMKIKEVLSIDMRKLIEDSNRLQSSNKSNPKTNVKESLFQKIITTKQTEFDCKDKGKEMEKEKKKKDEWKRLRNRTPKQIKRGINPLYSHTFSGLESKIIKKGFSLSFLSQKKHKEKVKVEVYLSVIHRIKQEVYIEGTKEEETVFENSKDLVLGILSGFQIGNFPAFKLLDSISTEQGLAKVDHYKIVFYKKLLLSPIELNRLFQSYQLLTALFSGFVDITSSVNLTRILSEEALKQWKKIYGNSYETSLTNNIKPSTFEGLRETLNHEVERYLQERKYFIVPLKHKNNNEFDFNDNIIEELSKTLEKKKPGDYKNDHLSEESVLRKMCGSIKQRNSEESIFDNNKSVINTIIHKNKLNQKNKSLNQTPIRRQGENELNLKEDYLLSNTSQNNNQLPSAKSVLSNSSNIHKEVSIITNEDFIKFESKYHNEHELRHYLQRNLFISADKSMLDLKEVIFPTEDSTDFIFKVSRIMNQQEIENNYPHNHSQVIKRIQLVNFPLLHKKPTAIPVKNLLLKEETNSSSVLNFREYYFRLKEEESSENLNVNSENELSLEQSLTNKIKFDLCVAIGNPVQIGGVEYSYDKNFHLKNSKVQKKLNTMEIETIVDLNNIRQMPFIDKNGYLSIKKLPSILANFEKLILLDEIIESYNVLSREEILNLTVLEKTVFLHSVTTTSCLEDYEFETIETLGDSYLKFATSFALFVSRRSNESEGSLTKKRTQIISNTNLTEVGRRVGVEKKIFTAVLGETVNKWSFPLECRDEENIDGRNHSSANTKKLSEKNIADLVEAVIGAFGYVSLKSIFKLLDFLGLFEKLTNYEMANVTNTELFNNVNENTIVQFKNQFKLSELIENYIGEDPSIERLNVYDYSKRYLFLKEDMLLCTLIKQKKIFSVNQSNIRNNHFIERFSHIEEVEKVIEYEFKDKSLLTRAFTLRLTDNSFNLEQMEFLGDSIVELFLSDTAFKIMYCADHNYSIEGRLFDNKNTNFNNQLQDSISSISKAVNPTFLTSMKSFLASNRLMNIIMIISDLHHYINLSYSNPAHKNTLKSLNNYLNSFNVSSAKINEYYEEQLYCPKIVSDVFEALVAAVFLDSHSMSKTYSVLNLFYSDLILYTIKFNSTIKFSPVNDLVKLMNEKKLVCLFFCRKERKQISPIKCNNGKGTDNNNGNSKSNINKGKQGNSEGKEVIDPDIQFKRKYSKYLDCYTKQKHIEQEKEDVYVVEAKIKYSFEDLHICKENGDTTLCINKNKELADRFLLEKGIKIESVISEGKSTNQDRAKEICCINALKKYF